MMRGRELRVAECRRKIGSLTNDFSLRRCAFGFHAFEPGVEVVEDVAGLGMKDAADEDVGHRAAVVRILADELADAELAGVPGFGQLADPGRAAGEVGHPFAELFAGRVALPQAFDDRVGGELAAFSANHTPDE